MGKTKKIGRRGNSMLENRAIPIEKIKEMRQKLSMWMFHNSESVCGDHMIDVDYLEGHIDELFVEYGIYEYDEKGRQSNDNKRG